MKGIALAALALALSVSNAFAAEKESANAISKFREHLNKYGSISFRSWSGIAYRMDSDTELTFFANNSVYMFEWGIALMNYRGKYRIHADGTITLEFEKFNKTWPVMRIEEDSHSLLLRPAKNDVEFVMGNRGGATMPPSNNRYWPFRMLTGKDEEELLLMIRRLN
jgi:hypothetical protein